MRKNLTWGVAVLAASLTLAGCSSAATDDGGSASADGFSEEAKAEAQAMVDEYSPLPTAPELAALGTAPSPDELVVSISCPLPQCTPLANGFSEGAAELGWDAKVLISDFAPDSFISTWESALAMQPDAIQFISMFPHDTIQSQLDQAAAAGIELIETAPAPDVEVGGDSVISGATSSVERTALYARLQAALIIADAESSEGITFMYAEVPSYQLAADEFEKAITDAGGSVDLLPVSQQDIGTKVPEQVVSHLQRNPDTKYLVAIDDSFLPGVPEAIAASGLTAPKLIGSGVPSEQTLAWIENGQQFATVAGDLYTDGWNAIDILARLSVGEEPENPQPVGIAWVVTAENVEDYPAVFAGIPDAYTEAWQVS